MLVSLILAACSPDTGSLTSAETEWIQNIAVTTSDDIPMVLEVTFDTPQAATAWVEFGDGSPDESVTASKDATSHEFAVIGGQPLSDVYMRVIVEFDGEQYESGIFTHTTGQQLPEMPTFEVMVNNYDPPESAVLLMSVYNNPSALVMLDFDGQVVWSRGTIDNSDGLGVGVLPMNGEIYYNTFSDNRWRNAQLTRMSLSGEVLQTIDTPDAHHFFTPGPDNEIAWIQYDAETPDTQSPVYGDRIVIGVDNPQPLISTWDHLTFEANAENLPEWTHANWVEYNPERDSYLMSTAFTDVIIEADTDGNPLRIMGGVNAAAGDSDYSFESQESQFSFPHGPHWTSKGDLLVFSTRNGISSAVRYEVDDDTSTLREQWRFGEDLRLNALALGEVQELPDDNILINWGSVGIIQVVEPSTDTVLWEARSGLQEFPAQVHYMDSPYATR